MSRGLSFSGDLSIFKSTLSIIVDKCALLEAGAKDVNIQAGSAVEILKIMYWTIRNSSNGLRPSSFETVVMAVMSADSSSRSKVISRLLLEELYHDHINPMLMACYTFQ